MTWCIIHTYSTDKAVRMQKLILLISICFSTSALAIPVPTFYSVEVVGVRTLKQLPTAKDMSITKDFNLASGNWIALNCLIGQYGPYGELVIRDKKGEIIPLPLLHFKECLKLMAHLEESSEREPVMIQIRANRFSVNEKL